MRNSGRRSRKCPICGYTGIPIAYGYPTGHLFDAADMKLVELGGCVIAEDMPTWWCEKEQYGWDGPDTTRAIREAIREIEAEAAPAG